MLRTFAKYYFVRKNNKLKTNLKTSPETRVAETVPGAPKTSLWSGYASSPTYIPYSSVPPVHRVTQQHHRRFPLLCSAEPTSTDSSSTNVSWCIRSSNSKSRGGDGGGGAVYQPQKLQPKTNNSREMTVARRRGGGGGVYVYDTTEFR